MGGFITQLIGNYQGTKLAEQQQKMQQLGREIQVNRYVLMNPQAKPADKEAAGANLDRLLEQYGGPQAKAHRPMIGQVLRGLVGMVQQPQTPATPQAAPQMGAPPTEAGGLPLTGPNVPGAPSLAGLAGRPQRPGQQPPLQGISPEELRWARMSAFAGGPKAEELEQTRQRITDAVRRGDITPAEGKEALRDAVTAGGEDVKIRQAKALEQAKLDIQDAHDQGQTDKALKRLEGIKNIISPEEYSRIRVELETGVKLSTGRAVSQAEEFNTHALREKARELGKFNAAGQPDPMQLTDAEYIDAVTQAKEGTLGSPAYDPSKTPPSLAPGQRNEEVLRGQPEGIVQLVKELVNYAVPMPSSFALANPKSPWNKAMTLAAQYDPTFDASQYQVRLATKKDFTSGKAAGNLRSINTLVGHLASLDKSAQALGNIPSGTYGPFTGLANMVRTLYRGASQEPKLKTFADDVNAVETELATVFKGTGGTDAEIKAWRSKIDASSSPEELRAHVLEAVNLMRSRMDFMKDQYENAMGRPFNMRFLSPENERKLEQLTGFAGGRAAAPTAPAAGAAGGAGAGAGAGDVIEWERGPDGRPRPKQQ